MTVDSIDDLEDDETYHYIPQHDQEVSDEAIYTFDVDLDFVDVDDFADYGEGAVCLDYHDGYCADVPVSNFERDIDDGRIEEGPL